MIRILAAAALTAALLAPAPARADSVRMSLDDAFAALQALHAFDAGWKKPDGTTVAFQLGGPLRLLIASDIRKLTGPIDDFRHARESMKFESPGADAKGSPAEAKFNAQSDALSALQKNFDVDRISTSDLHVGDGINNTNPIPVGVLAALGPLLK